MIRRWFQLSLKIFPELLVALSCWSKSAAFLVLPLGSGSCFLHKIMTCEVRRQTLPFVSGDTC